MPRVIIDTARNRATIFVAGFCLGAAFMASPAIGLILGLLGVMWILFIR